MIRIDAIWLATEPMDMRAGTDTALARVIAVFGAAQPHCAYLFATHPDPSRTGQYSLPMRLRPQAHRRGCQREAGLRARRIFR
ncbi:IS66 Orf2 like protein [Pseudomonas caricapapayae]|uniref:IS66 Orf2 like protein n=1 Tax=Pseudomonas caricapapayae TaxID=46678 RepID=A0A3M3B257_9PSED|nr:IS66 Orf2 like protein [Pseudomonas caricapapayae]